MFFFKSIAVTALYSAIITAVTGAPTPMDFVFDVRGNRAAPKTNSPSRGTGHGTLAFNVPTVENFVSSMQGKVPKDKSLFWCLPPTNDHPSPVQAYTYAQKHGLHLITDYVDHNLEEQAERHGVSETFWNHASQAFARVVSGKVYVLLPPLDAQTKPMDWHGGCVWARLEWPELQKNQHAEVYRISSGQQLTDGVKIK